MNDKSYEPYKGDAEKQSKSNRILKIIIVILLILLLFVVTTGVVVFVPLIQESLNKTPTSGVELDIDQFAGAFVEQKPEPGIVIPGMALITIPVNAKVVNTVDLYNPEKNEGNYYLSYKLSLLDENGKVSETLYESGLLPPGDHIQTITLSRGLSSGRYNAVMQVQPYRMADKTPTNAADLKLTIVVK